MSKSRIQMIIIICLILTFIAIAMFFANDKKVETEFGNYENKYDKPVEVISEKNEDGTYKLDFPNKWKYDQDNDIYYQIGIVYCAKPESIDYQCMSIYVPGKYLNATPNEGGTYTCVQNPNEHIGQYTVSTAPIVMPLNASGFGAQKSTIFYESNGLKEYMDAGLIYVYAGCRGLSGSDSSVDGTAPWGATDIKAAIRYLKYNESMIPGNEDRIFMLGAGEGGALSTIVAASGNSNFYTPYLEHIGAVIHDRNGRSISDGVYGCICWSPTITSGMNNAAYEWNLGQYVDTNTREESSFTKALSDDLSKEYANYINGLNLRDDNRRLLRLEESEDGIYTQGTYYQYVKACIENSLNTFITKSNFPIVIDNVSSNSDAFPGSNNRGTGVPSSKKKRYDSVKEYIDEVNKTTKWVIYDEGAGRATITSIKDFVNSRQKVTKDVCAYDGLTRNQVSNKLFSVKKSKNLHYDDVISDLLKNNIATYSKLKRWNKTYPNDYASDLQIMDEMNNSVSKRVRMYDPMVYLLGEEDSDIAACWRINFGMNQTNIPSVVEINMYLALKSNNLKKLDYTSVWEQESLMTELDGDAIHNCIEWIASSL